MDDRTNEAALSLTKFGIGQPVLRSEDPTLVRGEGRYTDDINRPGQAYAVMVRSSVPHGVIRGIDTVAAKALPGVLAVYTAADLTGYGGLKCNLPLKSRDGTPIRYMPRPALAGDKVRYVGDPVACVIAESIAQAKDAAEAVALDIEPLPAVISARDAAKPGAPQLWDDVPGNIALDYHYGDKDKVAEAFTKAAHVVRLPLINQRLVVNTIEPRSAIGEYDGKDEKWTLHSCSQGVFGLKNMLMDILGAPAPKVRVLTGNVGGSFGMKAASYPEYVCILHGARTLGRPVKQCPGPRGTRHRIHRHCAVTVYPARLFSAISNRIPPGCHALIGRHGRTAHPRFRARLRIRHLGQFPIWTEAEYRRARLHIGAPGK